MLAFFTKDGTPIAVYDRDDIPASAHPGCKSRKVSPSEITINEDGALILTGDSDAEARKA